MTKRQHLRMSHRFYVLLIMGIMAGSLFVFNSSASYAATIEVHPGESIQSAIDRAVSGDTVFVFSGTYPEDIVMKDGIDVNGDSYARVILKGRVIFKDAACALKNVSVLFPESMMLSYVNSYYVDFKLEADAGITAINSIPEIKNCVIKPDLEAINDLRPGDPPLERYGKALQIWNMYNNPDVSPWIEGNLIQNADCGIYYFAQAFGGVIAGDIKNNTLYNNKIGITLRMHKENPMIKNNIFDGCLEVAIHFTYEDSTLLEDRKSRILNNLFNANLNNLFVDSSQASFALTDIPGSGNIALGPLDSLYLIVTDNMFYLDPDSPAATASDLGTYIGAYPADAVAPAITIVYPSLTDKKFMGEELIVSGSALDADNGIWYVDVEQVTAYLNGTDFSATLSVSDSTLSYGLNSITATAHDLAARTTTTAPPREIYLFRVPIAAPQF